MAEEHIQYEVNSALIEEVMHMWSNLIVVTNFVIQATETVL